MAPGGVVYEFNQSSIKCSNEAQHSTLYHAKTPKVRLQGLVAGQVLLNTRVASAAPVLALEIRASRPKSREEERIRTHPMHDLAILHHSPCIYCLGEPVAGYRGRRRLCVAAAKAMAGYRRHLKAEGREFSALG